MFSDILIALRNKLESNVQNTSTISLSSYEINFVENGDLKNTGVTVDDGDIYKGIFTIDSLEAGDNLIPHNQNIVLVTKLDMVIYDKDNDVFIDRAGAVFLNEIVLKCDSTNLIIYSSDIKNYSVVITLECILGE